MRHRNDLEAAGRTFRPQAAAVEIYLANARQAAHFPLVRGCTWSKRERSPVFHELSDVAGFAPWRGACIEDFFCGFGIKKLAGDHCARILNIAMAIIESVLRQSIQFYELSIAYQRPRLWILLEEFSAIDF